MPALPRNSAVHRVEREQKAEGVPISRRKTRIKRIPPRKTLSEPEFPEMTENTQSKPDTDCRRLVIIHASLPRFETYFLS